MDIDLDGNDFTVRPVWSLLSVGRTGTGKTILSCSKYFRPTYVFNIDGRFESVKTYYKKLDGHLKDVRYGNYSMAAGNYSRIDKKMDQLIARPDYKTIVVAGMTAYNNVVLAHLKGSGGKGARIKAGIQGNTLEDFGFSDAAIIFDLLGGLQQLKENGANVILEAHEAYYEQVTLENGQRVSRTINEVLIKGKKAPAQIPGYFNEVWHFEKRFTGDWENQVASYRVNTVGDSANDCKTSFGIKSFDWTGVDPGEILEKQLDPTIASEERRDPNAPEIVTWG